MFEQSYSLEDWFILGLEITLLLCVIAMFIRLALVYRHQKALTNGDHAHNGDPSTASLFKNSDSHSNNSTGNQLGKALAPAKGSRASRNQAIQARLGQPTRNSQLEEKETREADQKAQAAMKIIKQQTRSLSSSLAVNQYKHEQEYTAQSARALHNQKTKTDNSKNTSKRESSPQAILDDYIGDFFN